MSDAYSRQSPLSRGVPTRLKTKTVPRTNPRMSVVQPKAPEPMDMEDDPAMPEIQTMPEEYQKPFTPQIASRTEKSADAPKPAAPEPEQVEPKSKAVANKPQAMPKHLQKQPAHVQAAYMRTNAIAEYASQKLGIPKPLIQAQLIYEGGWKPSELAEKHFNLAGIKAAKGEPYVMMPSFEQNKSRLEVSPFRKFTSAEDFAENYVKFLQKPRYAPLRQAKTVREFGELVCQTGYCADTPSSYATAIQSIMRRIDPDFLKNNP